jgi:hypothetical protein
MGTLSFDFRDFHKVRAEQAVSVTIVRADMYGVTATAEDVSHIRVEKAGDTLRIGRRIPGLLSIFRDRPHVSIAMPDIEEIVLNGAAQGKAQGFRSDRDLALKLSGASHLETADLQCGGFKVDISGASNLVGSATVLRSAELVASGASRVELAGSSNEARVELSGASQARLYRLTLNGANINVSGASNAQLTVNGKLDVALSGASRLEYSGNPSLGDVRVTGASTLTRR